MSWGFVPPPTLCTLVLREGWKGEGGVLFLRPWAPSSLSSHFCISKHQHIPSKDWVAMTMSTKGWG